MNNIIYNYKPFFLYAIHCFSSVALIVCIKKASSILHLPGTNFVAYRILILLVMALPLMIYKKFNFINWKNLKFNFPKDFLAFISTWIWYGCAIKVAINDIIVISFLTPMWSVLLASYFLKEKGVLKIIPFIFLSLIGVIIAVGPNMKELSWYYIALLIAGVLRAISNISAKRSTSSSTLMDMILLNILITSPLALSINPNLTFSLNYYFIFFNLLIVVLYISYLYYGFKSLSMKNISTLQPVDFIRLPSSYILSYIFLRENVDFNNLLGSAIIIGSSIGFFYISHKKQSPSDN